ncbi:hypothetical protein ACM66B_000594 [Microbotryomycetes sp. NB124-2]
MLSIITSLALNLRHSRSQRQADERRLEAQVDVLQDTISQLQTNEWSTLSTQDKEQIEKRLERVGLGRAKGKARDDGNMTKSQSEMLTTSWTEVLFGKRGKQFEQEHDDTDWDKVLREADEAETKRQQGVIVRPESTAPIPLTSAPQQRPLPASQPKPRPSQASTPSSGVYL